jgi:uncharacterized membrane protein
MSHPAFEDRPATPTLVRRLGQLGVLDRRQLAKALTLTRARADGAAWRHFAERALLFFGLALVCAAVIFFFAANWNAMERTTRLGLALLAHVVAVAAGIALGTDKVAGRAAAAGAALLVGPALLTYGQAYQTGADAWELFAAWAVLASPFAVVVRGTAPWAVVLVLLHVAGLLFVQQHNDMWSRAEPYQWLTIALCALDLVAARIARRVTRASASFAPLVFTLLAVLTAALPLLAIEVGDWRASVPAAALVVAAIGAHVVVARNAFLRGDAPLLAIVLLSIALHTGTACARFLLSTLHLKEGGLFLLAGFVLASASGMAALLHVAVKRARVPSSPASAEGGVA